MPGDGITQLTDGDDVVILMVMVMTSDSDPSDITDHDESGVVTSDNDDGKWAVVLALMTPVLWWLMTALMTMMTIDGIGKPLMTGMPGRPGGRPLTSTKRDSDQ